MAAPKGNQYAVGNNGGRPPKYDLDQEARELDAWSLREDATSLYQFTDLKDYLAADLSDFARRSEEFGKALKKAKERIGQRREKKVHEGTFNYGIQQRSAAMYDRLLHEHEEEVKDNEARRKQSTQVPFTQEQLAAFAALSNQLLDLQKKPS